MRFCVIAVERLGERAQSFLGEENIQNIISYYSNFIDMNHFSRIFSSIKITTQNAYVNISLYFRNKILNGKSTVHYKETLNSVITYGEPAR